MTTLNHITDWIAAHMEGLTLAGICLTLFIISALEYWNIWKQGQKKLLSDSSPKYLNTTEMLINRLVRDKQKCRCNWLITCLPCGNRLGRADDEIKEAGR